MGYLCDSLYYKSLHVILDTKTIITCVIHFSYHIPQVAVFFYLMAAFSWIVGVVGFALLVEYVAMCCHVDFAKIESFENTPCTYVHNFILSCDGIL